MTNETRKDLTQNKAGADQSKPASCSAKKLNTNIPKKWVRVLSALVDGKSYNRFEAECQLNDHCLHTTISTIQNEFGVTVNRKGETVPGYQGIPTRVKRYSLDRDAANLKRAEQLLGRNKSCEVPS